MFVYSAPENLLKIPPTVIADVRKDVSSLLSCFPNAADSVVSNDLLGRTDLGWRGVQTDLFEQIQVNGGTS